MGERAQPPPGRHKPGSQHVIRFSGKGIDAHSAPFLRDLLDVLVDGAQQATRLQVDGRSTAPGTLPGWLDAASRFDLARIHAQEIVLSAPSLVEAAPQRFKQLDLFSAGVPDRSCLDYLEDSLEDALAGREDSERYDRPLMSTLEGLGRLFRHGVESIEIVNGRTLRIDPRGVDVIRTLEIRTPEDRRVMVAGKLETIRHSDRAFSLVLESGESLRGVVATDQIGPEDLAALFGRQALVGGQAKFRPSGSPLRIEADLIEPASGNDVVVFSSAPTPLFGELHPREVQRAQGSKSGLAAIVGQWPGDETDEQVRAALADLS